MGYPAVGVSQTSAVHGGMTQMNHKREKRMVLNTIDTHRATMLMGAFMLFAYGTWGGASAWMNAGAKTALKVGLFPPIPGGLFKLVFAIGLIVLGLAKSKSFYGASV